MQKLTASLEDYLEVIYNNTAINPNYRAVDISREFNISRASVTEALRKLVAKGYITYERHDSIVLTDSGKMTAEAVVSKHSIIQDFFEKILGLSQEEASQNACEIEHVITDNAFEKMKLYMGKQIDNECIKGCR